MKIIWSFVADYWILIKVSTNEVEEKTPKSHPPNRNERRKPDEESESNYDDEYDDVLPEEVNNVDNVDVESVSRLYKTNWLCMTNENVFIMTALINSLLYDTLTQVQA